jgi:replicative DNA helicase
MKGTPLRVVQGGQRNPAGRTPPNDLDEERAVLADVILKSDDLPIVRDILSIEDFFSPAHQIIYEAICSLADAGSGIDVVTVASWLRDRDKMKEIGGVTYLGELIDATPSLTNVESHARVVLDKSRIRKMIATAQAIAAEGYGDVGEDVQEWVDSASSRIWTQAQSAREDALVTIGDAADQALDKASKYEPGKITGTSTGIRELDELTAGVHGGEVALLTAPTGGGKTSLATSIAMNVAAEGGGALIFGMEMQREELGLRLCCSAGRVNLNKHRLGQLDLDDFRSLYAAAEWLKQIPLIIDDTPSLTPTQIRGRVERVIRMLEMRKEPIGLKLIVVDYLQLMDGLTEFRREEPHATVEQGVDYCSKQLMRMAKETGTSVLLLSQLTDDGKIRYSRGPSMHAQTWIDIEKQEEQDRRWEPTGGPLSRRLKIRKQRHGPDGVTIDLLWYRNYALFSGESSGPRPV